VHTSPLQELKVETEALESETPIPETGNENTLETSSDIPSERPLETRRLPVKRARYLDMSIQDWSQADSSSDNLNDIDFEGSFPESVGNIPEADSLENHSENSYLEMEPVEEEPFTEGFF